MYKIFLNNIRDFFSTSFLYIGERLATIMRLCIILLSIMRADNYVPLFYITCEILDLFLRASIISIHYVRYS